MIRRRFGGDSEVIRRFGGDSEAIRRRFGGDSEAIRRRFVFWCLMFHFHPRDPDNHTSSKFSPSNHIPRTVNAWGHFERVGLTWLGSSA